MDSPAIDLYATEELDDALGNGIRIYRSDDTVFEARTWNGGESRIYRGDGVWRAKILFPETDLEDAYDRFIGTAETVNEEYNTDLDLTPRQFGDRIAENGRLTLADDDVHLHYVTDTNLDELVMDIIDELQDEEVSGTSYLKGILTGGAAAVGGGSALGAGIGALVGAPAGPPGVGGGAMAGATVGGGVAGFWTGIEGLAGALTSRTNPDDVRENRDDPLYRCLPTVRATNFFEDRRRTRYIRDTVEAMADHVEALNQLNSLKQEMDEARTFREDDYEELKAMDAPAMYTAHDAMTKLQFTRFEERNGVTATYETDTYQDAARFLLRATETTTGSVDRPSLYRAPDAFHAVFDHLTYTEDGETRYLEDAKPLVRTVYDKDAAPTIVDWLEEEHTELVQRVGQERAMGGERDG